METSHTVNKVKQLWAAWDIRVFLLTSLLIQALLTFAAPQRKCRASAPFNFSMWLLYLSADAIALYTIGLISSGQNDSPHKAQLMAFWAPFLLLHLGGPDTITALALEDNELWHRHTLQLVTQVGVTLYVCVQSFRHNRDLLWGTLLMFGNGCIKYVERICALYVASDDVFRDFVAAKPQSGPNYVWLMEEYYAAGDAHIPVTLQRKVDEPQNTSFLQRGDDEDLEDQDPSHLEDPISGDGASRKMVHDAYRFYEMFKGLLADVLITYESRKESRDYFLHKPNREALAIIEIELNLIYDIFYTKAFLLKRKRAYLRVLTFLSLITSFLLFCFKDRKNYKGVDLLVTFALLGGAIVLDACAAIMFFNSDWWFILTDRAGIKSKFLPSLLQRLPRLPKLPNCLRKPHKSKSRWSRTVPQYCLMIRCLKDPPYIFNIIFMKRLRDDAIGWLYSDNKDVSEQLLKFILSELRSKAEFVSNDFKAIKKVCSARGNLVLQPDCFLLSELLYPWTMGIDFDESLLTWHFATDICYLSSENISPPAGQTDYRELSKTLSHYMSYLLLMKKGMVSSVVGNSDMFFQNTQGEVKKLIQTKMVELMSAGIIERGINIVCNKLRSSSSQNDEELMQQFCIRVLESYDRPIMDQGDTSKYILFNARQLALQLNQIGEKQWEVMSKVWLELLCYAAVRCTPRSHVEQLSKGGELITQVWLLMIHYGIGECFLQNQGINWTKLIIHK